MLGAANGFGAGFAVGLGFGVGFGVALGSGVGMLVGGRVGSGGAVGGAAVDKGIAVSVGGMGVGELVGASTSTRAGRVLGATVIAGAGFLGPFTKAAGSEQTVQRASRPTQKTIAFARMVVC